MLDVVFVICWFHISDSISLFAVPSRSFPSLPFSPVFFAAVRARCTTWSAPAYLSDELLHQLVLMGDGVGLERALQFVRE